MTNLLARSARFFRELRRRRVIRNVLGYAALSLLLIEAGNNILPPLGFSEDGVRFIIWGCFAGLPVVVALSWVYDITEGKVVRTAREDAIRGRADADDVPRYDRRHLVVLPFEDLSGDDARYFADGIADDLTTVLARIADLRVISQTSARTYRGGDRPTRTIAHELRVGSVVEGTVRRAGERVRIGVRLIDAQADRPVWSESYDRDLEDVLALQAEVAEHIASSLEAELQSGTRTRLARVPTADVGAYDAYLQGRFHWAGRTEDGLEASLEHLERALALDPEFALAFAALAESAITLALYGLRDPGEVLPRARSAARRALDLDPGNGEARASLACVRAIHEWDWEGAERGFAEAVAASPSYATAHQWRAMHLHAPRGRFDAARADLERARVLDPAAPAIPASEAFIRLLEGRGAEAAALCRVLLEANPSFTLVRLFLGEALLLGGEPEAAVAEFEATVAARGRSPDPLAGLARARAAAGDEPGARAARDELRALSDEGYVSPSRCAEVDLALGDLDAAVAGLDRAMDRRAVDLIWLVHAPAWAPLRDHPAFGEARRRIGL